MLMQPRIQLLGPGMASAASAVQNIITLITVCRVSDRSSPSTSFPPRPGKPLAAHDRRGKHARHLLMLRRCGPDRVLLEHGVDWNNKISSQDQVNTDQVNTDQVCLGIRDSAAGSRWASHHRKAQTSGSPRWSPFCHRHLCSCLRNNCPAIDDSLCSSLSTNGEVHRELESSPPSDSLSELNGPQRT